MSGELMSDGKDLYIFACYIPPVNSTYYNNHDIDLFVCLEDLICQYREDEHNIMVIGDFNSRTGNNDDFIHNDRLNDESTDLLSNIFHYIPDTAVRKRRNIDSSLNQFGRQLLTLCKTTSLRIVNGRHDGDPDGNITFYNSRDPV